MQQNSYNLKANNESNITMIEIIIIQISNKWYIDKDKLKNYYGISKLKWMEYFVHKNWAF